MSRAHRHSGAIVTGAEYVRQLSARGSDRRARASFRALVDDLARPGAVLLDFGCGTGTDARYYAERGFVVRGYDVDSEMCDFFECYCKESMADGRVSLERGSYAQFLASTSANTAPVDLITANFAPLNLIQDLRPLFAKFHAMTAPQGKLLASMLSPYFIGDIRYRWWWRNLPTLVRHGQCTVRGAQAQIVRRRLSHLAAQSAPYFALQAVLRGGRAERTIAHSIPASSAFARLPLIASRYMFLLFTRQG